MRGHFLGTEARKGGPNADVAVCLSSRYQLLDQGVWTDSCRCVAAVCVETRGERRAELLAADWASLRDLPLRAAGADAVRTEIQVGRVRVYDQARSDRREKGSQLSAAPARSFSAFRGVRHVVHSHQFASAWHAEWQLSVSARRFAVPCRRLGKSRRQFCASDIYAEGRSFQLGQH